MWITSCPLTYTPNEPGYYHEGVVPQVLVFNKSGEVVAEPERSGAVRAGRRHLPGGV